jgi:hypothetical protein
MTGYAGIDALIGFAVAVLVIGLLVIAGLAKAARPKGKGLELEAAYRRFSTSADSAAVDAEEVDAAASESKNAAIGTGGVDDDDTVETPPVLSGGRHPLAQLPKQQEEVDPAATVTEKVDTRAADPDLEDTVEMPPVLAGPGLTAVRRGSAFPSRLRDAGLITACTQPACTGTIVDAYCDVCGSPAGAVPFVSAGQRLHPSRPPGLA